RPGTGPGEPARLRDPGGGDDPERLGQVVDVGVAGGVVAAGPGGEPAADGGELEGLREMPQRVARRPQLVLEMRAERPRLDPRGPADLVELEHPVHRAHVEAHDPGAACAVARLDPTDDGAAATEGDDDDASVPCPG